jgi:chemotaxis protein MotA
MDLGALLGLLLAGTAITLAVVAGGGRPGAFLDLPSAACVCGGTLAAVMISFPFSQLLRLGAALRGALFGRPPNMTALVDRIVELADLARREGLLALDDELPTLRDPLLVLALELAVDGTPPEVIEEVLRAEVRSAAAREAADRNMLDQAGKYAPAFGMIGTVLGLVMMLGGMSDPDAIGPGMAVALLTTLYGALLANVVFLPLAEKLGELARRRRQTHEAIIRGVIAIQSGDSPRMVRRKLSVYLPPRRRQITRLPERVA